jgi:KDO2-lipid IV(A) lauroyltransferase
MRRVSGSKHEVVITRLPDLPTDRPAREVIAETTQQLNDSMEAWIRKYPDQWMWTHRRFKPVPPELAGKTVDLQQGTEPSEQPASE